MNETKLQIVEKVDGRTIFESTRSMIDEIGMYCLLKHIGPYRQDCIKNFHVDSIENQDRVIRFLIKSGWIEEVFDENKAE